MVSAKAYFRENKRKNRLIDKELARRYHSWEQMPGEPYHEFKKRLTGKTINDDNQPKL